MSFALEDQQTAAGMKARAHFMGLMLQNYPSPWESIDPNKHSYARLDYV